MVMTATPLYLYAWRTASSMSAGNPAAVVAVRLNTATSAKMGSSSMVWKKSMFMNCMGTWPTRASTGTWSSRTSYRPLSRWTAPGPEDPKHTPMRPVSLASAEAAMAPPSS